MNAQASSSNLSALFTAAPQAAAARVSEEAAKLNIIHRLATASTVITCAYFAALTILG